MNYLEELAAEIRAAVPDGVLPDADLSELMLIYAVLARAKGPAVTAEDVHDAWAAWTTRRNPRHASLRPFADLPSDKRVTDEAFAHAIRSVASQMQQAERAGSAITRRRPEWSVMDARPRLAGAELGAAQIPTGPGVYAWYREGEPVYVGKATGAEGLRQRLWKNHMARGRGAISGSAFRRNVAAHLGFGSPAAIKADPALLTEEQVAAVNAWIRTCHVAWIETADDVEALDLERRLKQERRPPLTKV